MIKKLSILAMSLAIGFVSISAQDTQLRNAVSGQKYKIKGVVVSKENDSTMIIRDATNVDTKIMIAPNASIKNKAFWGGDNYSASSLVRGVMLETEGVGDTLGSVVVNKIRFERDNLETARSIDARVAPAEDRLTAAEQNAQRISGQIDELMAISNAAKGGAKAAQDTADAAVDGVNATNRRISELDDYVVQSTLTVNFRVNSAVLLPEGRYALDQLAATAMTLKGYRVEVTGHASAEGNARRNKELSERRAQAVKSYLIEQHNFPLRLFVESYGFGSLQAVADNSTRDGREQNRRVEVKLLVNRGINTNVEVRAAPGTSNER